MSEPQRFTSLGKVVSILLVAGLVALGVYMIRRGGDSPSAPGTASSDSGSKEEATTTAVKVEVPKLSPPAPIQIKDNIVPLEISEYAGYAGLIAANGGLEPNENSVFFKTHGFKVKLTVSEGENWSDLNEGKIAASVTTTDVLAVYGKQLHAVVPAQIGFSRGADAVVVAPNSSEALNNVIERARKGGMKVIVADTAITTDEDGFIGTDNIKAATQAGARMCQLAKDAGNETGDVMIASSVAGVQVLKDRDAGFRAGLKACPGLKVGVVRYNNNDLNTAASQVNDALTANPNLVGVFAANNTSGNGAARAIKDNNAADRIPVVAFDTDPQENAALADGSIDALVVQNPYFFGYQGVMEAAMATVGNVPPRKLDPGAVLADKANMGSAEVKLLLTPPTTKAQ